MADISKTDQNFLVKNKLNAVLFDFYSMPQAPFVVSGLLSPETKRDRFKRMPSDVAKRVSEGVFNLHCHTAGGRVRFRTNAKAIAIAARMGNIGKMPHFALTGSAGFDLYADNRYCGSLIPPFCLKNGYVSRLELENDGEKEITINFPLYSDVISLVIGLNRGAWVAPPAEYINEKPVVYYGSSITQGGCASRPGNSYQSIISRRLNLDYINLGFSGNAKGEPVMAEYIAGLPMSAFVYDYDHNAPTPEHLQKTHQKMFDIIRAKNPELPVIMVSRPKVDYDADTKKRFEIIKATYEHAIAQGDRNVYLINGNRMMNDYADDGATVDNCHPNDYGFQAMAKGIGDVLKTIFCSE